MGGRIREPEKIGTAVAVHCSDDDLPYLYDYLWRIRFGQVGGIESRECGGGPVGRTAGAVVYRNTFQRFIGCGIPGTLWRVGSDRRHHGGIHQSTPLERVARSRSR